MTDEEILRIAAKHQQHRDCREITLRGPGILEFARDLLCVVSVDMRGYGTIGPAEIIPTGEATDSDWSEFDAAAERGPELFVPRR